MNREYDNDLQMRFTAQRKAHWKQAPAWNPRLIEAPVKEHSFHLPRWWLITAAAAACLMLSLALLHQPSTPDLVTALPSLFETPVEPLFASLETTSSTPSDFLLPTYLSLQLP